MWNLIVTLLNFLLRCPSPRILHTICEENVILSRRSSSLVTCWMTVLRQITHINSENSLTHSWPIRHVEICRGAHNSFLVMTWGLEPAVLCAILVGPASCWRIEIYCCTFHQVCVIILRVYSWYSSSEFSHSKEYLFIRAWLHTQ
jgi:hypothetical protein